MLKKLKKVFPTVISAVLCVAMALGMTVSAQPVESKWNECKKLINSNFDQQYIDLAIKYSQKESKNTVVFSKSRTKKFIDKVNKAIKSNKQEFSIELSDKNNFEFIACKGAKAKYVYYEEDYRGCDCAVIFSDGKTATLLSLENKTKATTRNDESLFDLEADSSDIAEPDQKGKLFKFKSGDKIYYYEEFVTNGYYEEIFGMLFNESGEPLAAIVDDAAFCVSFKTTVDDSEFEIPKGYKTVDYDDFDYKIF